MFSSLPSYLYWSKAIKATPRAIKENAKIHYEILASDAKSQDFVEKLSEINPDKMVLAHMGGWNDWEKVEEKANVGHIKNLKTISRDVSGRIFVMEILGEKGSKILRRELEIRQHLGGLKSSCFVITDVKKDKDGYITSLEVAGAGFGHGVGMCQTGAQAMAGAKRTYDHILRHYFPEARLISLYK